MPEQLIDEEQLIPPGAIEVLPPYGFVRLLAYDADDLSVVNAARVSFNKESEWADPELADSARQDGRTYHGPLGEGDAKVLQFLLKNRHGTPFEHTYLKFHVRAPIFVFREWHRHRIGVCLAGDTRVRLVGGNRTQTFIENGRIAP